MCTDCIGRLYLHEANEEDKKRFKEPDLEWYTAYDKESPLMVYVYRF